MPEDGTKILIEGALVEGSQQADASGKGGMVTITLIREGFGNKRDNHYYPAELLEAAAQSFEGAQMYSDHLDEAMKKKLKGLPRPIKDLMGRIRETWVDKEDGLTVIRGKASISQKWLWDMVEHDPDLLGVSINARGSSSEGRKEGRVAKIVEAINDVGSVDWVSKAGAGGKVFALMEAQAEEEGYEVETDDDGDEETTEADAAATVTHHHHEHYDSFGAGKHAHVHSHSHPNAVEGESHRHVETLEAAETVEADSENPGDPELAVPHKHEHVHSESEGPGDHLHVHHHHHKAVEGEVHTHEGDGEGAGDGEEETSTSTETTDTDTGGESTTSTSTETPAENGNGGGEGDGEEETSEAAASAGDLSNAVHHHYHHHGSMGGGLHTHHHHHKAVAGETHEHVIDSGAGTPDATGYDSPSKSGQHNHHHHHASMGKGRHIHHHTHELTGAREAHLHKIEPLQEADAESEETEVAENEITYIDEANWIAGAIKHKGALHKDLGIPEGEKIPVSTLEEEAKKPGKVGKRARLALTLMKLRKGKKKKKGAKGSGKPAYQEGEAEEWDFDLDDEVVEAEVERRATALAEERLREGVRSAVEMTRAEFDKKLKEALAEKDFEWGRKVSQLEQRQVAASVIEASGLPEPTQKALKAEFHDAFYEDLKESKTGAVRKAGVDRCREAVKARIEKKREELKEYGASERISEAGETAGSREAGGERPAGEARPKKSRLDAEIDKELDIEPAPAAAGAGAQD